MSERLVHYSDRPVYEVVDAVQTDRLGHKPRGFWVSVDSCENNWRDWCEGEQWAIDRLTHAHDVMLVPDARILRISSAEELDEFHFAWLQKDTSFYGRICDWSLVVEAFDGIIIAPYIWSRRLSDICGWYYSWDCASGCIWRARAVASITLRSQEIAA